MDNIFEIVGSFGLYQRLMLVLIGGMSALVAMTFYSSVFMTAEPLYTCEYKSNYSNNSAIDGNYSLFTNKSINDDLLKNTCQIWSNIQKKNSEYNYSSVYTCNFDRKYYTTTIITEWNLICDRKYLASLTQTIFMIGTISGLTSGVISDRYGRKLSTIIFICLLSFTLVVSQLLLLIDLKNQENKLYFNYIVFCVSQFLIGIFVNGVYCTAYVLLLELTTENYHTIVSNINLYLYVFGELIVMISYYITRNWYSLSWIIAIYSMFFVLFTFVILPESPRWLITQKRFNEAFDILKKISRVNRSKKQSSLDTAFQHFIDDLNNEENKKLTDSTPISNDVITVEIATSRDAPAKMTTRMIFESVFCPDTHVLKIYLLIYIWISISLLYYGVSLGITSIDFNDPYLIFLISCGFEIVGLSLCYLNDKLGRKKALFIYLFTASVTCSVVAVIPQEFSAHITVKFVIKMALALIGKCMVSAAFNTCYMFTAELYKTSVRNTVILFLTCIGGFGSLVSPQINLLRSIAWEPLPYIIYSTSSFLACVALLFLPETHHN